ncbi:MAG: competence protein ComEC [Euryarchaeota archaeon]|nr:competence protein ComEC [Euryarchaeota archaeon]
MTNLILQIELFYYLNASLIYENPANSRYNCLFIICDCSSGQAFIDAVKPEVSIVSVGAGNTYGLPDEDALARIQAVSKLYRTDSDGPVVVTTDGSTYTVTTQKTGYEETGTASSHSESNASNSASSTATEEPNPAAGKSGMRVVKIPIPFLLIHLTPALL